MNTATCTRHNKPVYRPDGYSFRNAADIALSCAIQHSDNPPIVAQERNTMETYTNVCGSCGCGPCACDDPEPTTHYHVVAFINGCLNDYDSGPYDTLEDARNGLQWYLEPYNDDPTGNDKPHPAGEDRYTVGNNPPYIIKIEECTEPQCSVDDF